VGLLIKICGFTTPEGIAAAVEAGVDSIGLVLDPSPRQLTVERARELKAHIPEGVEVVAVCGRPTVEELRRIQRDLIERRSTIGVGRWPEPRKRHCGGLGAR
jgi:phosphoribosylanthranilate isomerase